MWEIDNLSKNDSLPNDGRSAKVLTEEERIKYLIKEGLVPKGYVYKEESPETIIESGDLTVQLPIKNSQPEIANLDR